MITLSQISDQTVALNTATAALAFTVSRTPIVAEVAVAAYLTGLNAIDLGTDAAALGIEIGASISGAGIPVGAVVASLVGDIVNSELSFTANGDGTPVTFAPPVAAVVVTAVSSDSIRIGSVTLGGTGASRTVTVIPATNKSGSATVEVKAVAGEEEALETFLITITPATVAYNLPATWTAQEVGPVVDVDAQGTRGTLRYAAPYPACVTMGNASYRPEPGSKITGLSVEMVVGTVKIEPQSAVDDGLAWVTVGLVPPERGEGTDSENEPVALSFRCHWENEMKPLHTADIYMPSGSKALDQDDLYDIEMWRSEPKSALKRLGKYQEEGQAEKTLSANAKHFAAKVQRGTETYPYAYPVVSKVGVSRLELSFATTMNKVYSSPPGFPKSKYPPGWLWVGVEDDREQQGRSGPKERSESYRGINAADRDLFKAG